MMIATKMIHEKSSSRLLLLRLSRSNPESIVGRVVFVECRLVGFTNSGTVGSGVAEISGLGVWVLVT